MESQTWQQRATPSWWTGQLTVPPQGPEPALDTRRIRTDRTIEDGFIARADFEYSNDGANNRINADEYDFGTSAGTIGSLLRRTHTDYVTAGGYTAVTPGATPFVNGGPHLRSLPLRRVVCATLTCDEGTFHAKTEFDYDSASIGSLGVCRG